MSYGGKGELALIFASMWVLSSWNYTPTKSACLALGFLDQAIEKTPAAESTTATPNPIRLCVRPAERALCLTDSEVVFMITKK